MSTIRKYSDDFKENAIKYVEEHSGLTLQQTAEYLCVPKETLYGWVRAHRRKNRNGNASKMNGSMTDSEKEIARLKRENRDLQDALQVLKKAISILNN